MKFSDNNCWRDASGMGDINGYEKFYLTLFIDVLWGIFFLLLELTKDLSFKRKL